MKQLIVYRSATHVAVACFYFVPLFSMTLIAFLNFAMEISPSLSVFSKVWIICLASSACHKEQLKGAGSKDDGPSPTNRSLTS